jgi:hypothetical protein
MAHYQWAMSNEQLEMSNARCILPVLIAHWIYSNASRESLRFLITKPIITDWKNI